MNNNPPEGASQAPRGDIKSDLFSLFRFRLNAVLLFAEVLRKHGPDGVQDGKDHDAHVRKDRKPHAGDAHSAQHQADNLDADGKPVRQSYYHWQRLRENLIDGLKNPSKDEKTQLKALYTQLMEDRLPPKHITTAPKKSRIVVSTF